MQQNNSEPKNDAPEPKQNFQSMSPLRKAGAIGIVVLMLAVIIFIVFFTDKSSKDDKSGKSKKKDANLVEKPLQQHDLSPGNVYTQKAESAAQLINNVTNKHVDLKPPAPPVLEQVVTPPPPPELKLTPSIRPIGTVPGVEKPQLPTGKVGAADAKAGPNISSSSVITFGGGDDKSGQDKNDKDKSKFLGFDGGTIDNNILQASSATPVVATKINSDLRYTIVQGKVVDAVLETAINTQMSAGIIRAVVSRDVYGEQGDLILIPKGSRLIGSYGTSTTTSSAQGQGKALTRVYASWKRVITPSGVDINLPDTPATDTLGRNGIPGYLDTNLTNNLMNAFLVSILGPYVILEVTGLSKQPTSTTTNNGGGNSGGGGSGGNNNNTTTVTSTAGAQALTQGLQQFQSVAQDQFNKVYPAGVVTNFVDQGTRIDIVVQQDIVFPKQAIALNTANLP